MARYFAIIFLVVVLGLVASDLAAATMFKMHKKFGQGLSGGYGYGYPQYGYGYAPVGYGYGYGVGYPTYGYPQYGYAAAPYYGNAGGFNKMNKFFKKKFFG